MKWLMGFDKGIQQRRTRVAHPPLDRAMRSRVESRSQISSVEVATMAVIRSHPGQSSGIKKFADDPFRILAASEGEERTRHGPL